MFNEKSKIIQKIAINDEFILKTGVENFTSLLLYIFLQKTHCEWEKTIENDNSLWYILDKNTTFLSWYANGIKKYKNEKIW